MNTRVRVKRGVILSYNIWWEFVEPCLEDFFGNEEVKEIWLTSALEGNHSAMSSHYEGRAWDIRKLSNMESSVQEQIAKDLQNHLHIKALEWGFSHWKFFVMFHGRPKHYHIQVKRGVDP